MSLLFNPSASTDAIVFQCILEFVVMAPLESAGGTRSIIKIKQYHHPEYQFEVLRFPLFVTSFHGIHFLPESPTAIIGICESGE